MQTLTALNLEWNEIGPQGVLYLAEALKHNTVKRDFYSCTHLIESFHIDT
jgi:hypothetical protein